MIKLKCIIRGHDLEKESIIPFICSDYWLKRCKTCGRYVAHGEIGSVTFSEKRAMELRDEAFELFPYMKQITKEES